MIASRRAVESDPRCAQRTDFKVPLTGGQVGALLVAAKARELQISHRLTSMGAEYSPMERLAIEDLETQLRGARQALETALGRTITG